MLIRKIEFTVPLTLTQKQEGFLPENQIFKINLLLIKMSTKLEKLLLQEKVKNSLLLITDNFN